MPTSKLDRAIVYQHGGATPRATSLFEDVMLHAETGADRAEAARRQAVIKLHQAQWGEATRYIEIARDAAAGAGDVDLMGEVLNIEAAILHTQGRHADAIAIYRRITEGPYGHRVRGLAHQNIGTCHARERYWGAAEAHYQASLECFRACGFVRGVCHALNNLGYARFEQGQLESARDYLARGIDLAARDGQTDLAALATLNRAEVHLADGALDAASFDAACAMGFFNAATDLLHLTDCLRVLGEIAEARGDAETAQRSYARGLRIAEEAGAGHEAASLRAKLETVGGAGPLH
jgi:tetratricopeptide (TPR) repeat protein